MITGTISVADFLRAQRLHRKSVRGWSYAFAAAALFISTLLFFFGMKQSGLICGFAGIGAFVGELVTARVYLPWKVRRLHSQQKALAQPFTYSWDREYIHVQGAQGSAKRLWTDYCKVKEDEDVILLYHADNLFEMLPKAWFGTAESLADFRALASGARRP